MSSPSFELIWKNYGKVDKRTVAGLEEDGASDTDAVFRAECIVKDRIKKLILQKMEDTNAGQELQHTIRANQQDMARVDWHKPLFQLPPVDGPVCMQEDGDHGEEQTQSPQSHGAIHLSSIEDLIRQREDAYLRKAIDLDTFSIITNRVYVFSAIRMGVNNRTEAFAKEQEALKRGRMYMVPRRATGDEIQEEEEEYRPDNIPALVIGKVGRGPRAVQAGRANVWPWLSKRLIGNLGHPSSTFLFVCQMAVTEDTPCNRVAWQLCVDFLHSEYNRVGASSSRVNAVHTSNNPCTLSSESLKQLDQRIRLRRNQIAYLDSRGQADLYLQFQQRQNRSTVNPEEEREPQMEEVICDRIRTSYLLMMNHLWFIGDMQMARRQGGHRDEAWAREEEPRGSDSGDIATNICQMIKKNLATINGEQRELKVFCVPSIAMEVSVVRRDGRGSFEILEQDCPYFLDPQSIRLHLRRDTLLEEVKAFRQRYPPHRHPPGRDDDEEDQPNGLAASLKLAVYSCWGSSQSFGPCGFSATASFPMNAALVREAMAENDGIAQFGISELCEPYGAPVFGEGIQQAGNMDLRDEGAQELYSSWLIGYETVIRGYTMESSLYKSQKDFVRPLLNLLTDEVHLNKTRETKAGEWKQLCESIQKTVQKFLDESPDGAPYRIEDTSICCISLPRDVEGNIGQFFEGNLVEHVQNRVEKLLQVDAERLFSYSYNHEFPEIVRSVTIPWIQILWIRGRMELRRWGTISYDLCNSFAMCIGALSHLLFGIERRLNKNMPMSLLFRSRAASVLRDGLKMHGIMTVPVPLLLGMKHEQRTRTFEWDDDGVLTYFYRLEDMERDDFNFVLRECFYDAVTRRRIGQRTPLDTMDEEQNSELRAKRKFVLLQHWFGEIMSMVPPSALPWLLLNSLAVSIVETLVRKHKFCLEIILPGQIEVENSKKRLLSARWIGYHSLTSPDKRTCIPLCSEGSPPLVMGCPDGSTLMGIFNDENFSKIIDFLRDNGGEIVNAGRGQLRDSCLFERRQSGHEELVAKGSGYIDRVVLNVLERLEPNRIFQPYNQTILMAFFSALINSLRPYCAVSAPLESIGVEGIMRQGSWIRELLNNVFIAALVKVRLPWIMSFTLEEERKGNYRFIPARYPTVGQPVADAIAVLKQYNRKFYEENIQFRMVLPNLDGEVEQTAERVTRQKKYEHSLACEAVRLFNSRMASYWALNSTQDGYDIKIRWHDGAEEQELAQPMEDIVEQQIPENPEDDPLYESASSTTSESEEEMDDIIDPEPNTEDTTERDRHLLERMARNSRRRRREQSRAVDRGIQRTRR